MDEGEVGSGRTYGTRFVAVVAVVAALLGGAVGSVISGRGPSGSPVVVAGPPTASLPPPVELALGQTGETSTGGRVTVLTWIPGIPPDWPAAPQGFEYSRAIVKFCSGPGVWNFRIREIPYLFNLIDSEPNSDDPIIDPIVDTRYGLEELASYNQGLLSPGECVVGSVVFRNRTYQQITAVRFTGHGRFDWDVSEIANDSSPAPTPAYSPGTVPNESQGPAPG